MTDTDKDRHQAVALFRYGLIAEFLHQPEGGKGLYARLREKAAAAYTIPGSRRTRVALETLRDWLKRSVAISGTDYLVGQFYFGQMDRQTPIRSVELFAEHVMPALRQAQSVPA